MIWSLYTAIIVVKAKCRQNKFNRTRHYRACRKFSGVHGSLGGRADFGPLWFRLGPMILNAIAVVLATYGEVDRNMLGE